MNTSKRIFAKYELPLFFLLTYLLSWWSAPFANGGLIPHGPAFSAILNIALTVGRQGLREFWRRLTNFRAGWWYLIGPAIILSYQGIAFAINVRLGATVIEPPHIPSMGVLLSFDILMSSKKCRF